MTHKLKCLHVMCTQMHRQVSPSLMGPDNLLLFSSGKTFGHYVVSHKRWL